MNQQQPARISAITQQRATLAALCLIVLGYCWAVLQYSRNAPYFDDILEALAFTEQYAAAVSINVKIRLFFISLNEHITSVNHAVYLLWYHISGSLNFRHFIWLGNVFVLATALVVNRGLRIGLRPFGIVVFLCVLNLQIWESTFWAMTALSNQGVLLFAALCFLVLDQHRNALWPALGFATLAMFTQANGLLVPIAVSLALGIDNYRSRQTILSRSVMTWLIIFMALLLLYKCTYHQMFPSDLPSDHPSFTTYLAIIKDNPLRLPLFFLSLAGSWTFTSAQFWSSVIAGMVIIALLCRHWFKQLWHRDSTMVTSDSFFVIAFTLYLLLSCVLITVGRGAFSAVDYALNSRYKMYSIFLVLLLLHSLAPKSRLKIIASTVLCGMLLATNVQRIANIELRNNMLHETYYNWIIDGGFGRANTLLIPEQDAYFFDGYNSGIYSAYSAVGDEFKPLSVQKETACTPMPPPTNTGNSVQAFSRQEKAIGIELTLHIAAESLAVISAPDLLLCTATHSYRVALHPASQQTLMSANNLKLLLLKQQFSAGQYQVLLQGTGKTDVRVRLGEVRL